MVIEYANDRDVTRTERESIENSISTIASTPYGSAPFTRNMGVKYPPQSRSALEQNRYAMEVITQCGIWENRAQIRQIVFDQNNAARMVVEYGKL